MQDRNVQPQLKVFELYGYWGSLDIHLAAFLPEVSSAGVLKGVGILVDGAAPGLRVSNKCRPLLVVNVEDTNGLLEGVFEPFLWCPSLTVASGELTIEGNLGQVMPPDSGDMPCPS